MNNELSFQELRKHLTSGDLGTQFVLKSNRAFDRIIFTGYKPVTGEDSFPARRSREIRAMKSIKPSMGPNDFFITDLTEEEVRPYDARLR